MSTKPDAVRPRRMLDNYPERVTTAHLSGWSRTSLEQIAADALNENRQLRTDLRLAIDAYRSLVLSQPANPSPTPQLWKQPMTTETTIESIQFTDLPALGAEFEGGKFAGITTQKDGTHVAVILLPNKAQELTWKKAMNWAEKLEAELPSRPVAALLFANVKSELGPKWHWTSEEDDSSYAWYCFFGHGTQSSTRKSYGGSAVAVRLIPLTA